MSNPLSKTDAVFLKHFAMVISFLVLVALLLGALSLLIYAKNPPPENPAKAEILQQRIAPVGAVYAGDTGRAAMQAAQQAAAAAAASQVAYGGTTDGKEIYDQLCHSCHTAGVAGAPKVGDHAAWGPRIAQGIDTLDTHAIQGFTGQTGVMPPKGGNPALTDEQVKAAVAFMVDQSK